jgi:hypothetical protein
MDIGDIMSRIKNLQQFRIITEVPDDFDFRGVVPYDMRIKDGVAVVTIWAVTLEEAQRKVTEYFQGEY